MIVSSVRLNASHKKVQLWYCFSDRGDDKGSKGFLLMSTQNICFHGEIRKIIS